MVNTKEKIAQSPNIESLIFSCLTSGGYIDSRCLDKKLTISKPGYKVFERSAISLLKSGKVKPVNCHSLMHSLGGYKLRVNKNYTSDLKEMFALKDLNSDCKKGYIHGIMDNLVLLKVVKSAELGFTLKKVCDTLWKDTYSPTDEFPPIDNDPYQVCDHGAGHALGVFYKGDYKAFVSSCNVFYSYAARYSCAGGMAMEWAHIVTKTGSINGRMVPGPSFLFSNGEAYKICLSP